MSVLSLQTPQTYHVQRKTTTSTSNISTIAKDCQRLVKDWKNGHLLLHWLTVIILIVV